MNSFSNAYGGKRVLVTGHTGFKGSWLCDWLQKLGAKLAGISLPPETSPNHWQMLNLDIDHRHQDIRDAEGLSAALRQIQPQIIFHLAAQPLVRRSYRQPLDTWSTNVMGTANLLEAARQCTDLQAIVVITTDKCYENREWPWGYRENDALGGHDPYSASKAATELVVASYRTAFFGQMGQPLLATARAGNVIGGGDWSEDRLIPDLVRAVSDQRSLEIRSPHATRPWQHVLESLRGYLMLGEKLIAGDSKFADAWNFGPDRNDNLTVQDVLQRLNKQWPSIRWHVSDQPQPHEAKLLYLDAAKAQQLLGWRPLWSIDTTLHATAEWYRHWLDTASILSSRQIDAYTAAMQTADAAIQ